jgi:hypothetical protein
MILVSFHGGKGAGAGASGGAAAAGYDNLIAYDDAGNELHRPLLKAKGVDMSELRGIHVVPNGHLWVASGGKHASAILCFQRSGSGLTWSYVSTVIDSRPTSCSCDAAGTAGGGPVGHGAEGPRPAQGHQVSPWSALDQWIPLRR